MVLTRQLFHPSVPDGQAGIDRIARELRAQLENIRQGFSREAVDAEISNLGLYTEDD